MQWAYEVPKTVGLVTDYIVWLQFTIHKTDKFYDMTSNFDDAILI